MLRHWAIATGSGLTAAILWLSQNTLSTVGLVLAALAATPLFLATLSGGLGTGLVATLAGAAFVGLIALQTGGLSTGLMTMVAFVLLVGGPVLVISRQALLWREVDGVVVWYPLDRLLLWVTATALPMVLVLVIQSNGPDQLAAVAEQRWVEIMAEAGMPTPSHEVLVKIAGVLNGVVGAIFAALIAVNAMIAQAILAQSGRALRPTPAYRTVGVPWWLVAALGLLSAVGVLSGGLVAFAALTLATILCLPVWLVGLAVLHALGVRTFGVGGPLVVIGVLISVLVWPALVVVTIGALDGRFGFRERLAPPS